MTAAAFAAPRGICSRSRKREKPDEYDRASVSLQPPRRILAILSCSEEANDVTIRIFQEWLLARARADFANRIRIATLLHSAVPRSNPGRRTRNIQLLQGYRAVAGLVDGEGCVALWTLKAGIAWEIPPRSAPVLGAGRSRLTCGHRSMAPSLDSGS